MDEFADKLVIKLRGRSLRRVTKTNAILWNSGNTTLRKHDFAAHDPLRICFPDNTKILQRRVSQVSAQALNVHVDRPAPGNALESTFDFLNPGDGFTVEIYHTQKGYASIVGSQE